MRGFIRTSIHHECDSPQGIGAIASEMRLTAPISWGRIVFMINTPQDYISSAGMLVARTMSVWGSGFEVCGLGYRVQGAGYRVQGAGCRVQGAGFTLS